MLELSHIDKYYNPGSVNEMCLFQDFNLTIPDSQFVSVVGSNGSGKTSLLNIICGSIPIEAGDVLVGDQSIAKLKGAFPVGPDGVEDEEVFPDQRFAAEAGKATPDFRGTPARKGYTFTGWTPEVAETVTAHATYTATWKVNSYLIHLDLSLIHI